VEYLEIRTLDLNVADPVGVNQTQLRFIEALLLYCLFADSPPIDASEQAEIDQRELLVAREGRRPGLEIPVGGAGVLLRRYGLDLLAEITPFAELLDASDEGYVDALEQQRSAMAEPELTPSARLLADMTTRGQSYLEFMLEVSRAHAAYFRSLTLAEDRKREFAELARTSVEDARDLENNTQESLEDYLAAYFAEA
jgi:glutamate--cysteine ligase